MMESQKKIGKDNNTSQAKWLKMELRIENETSVNDIQKQFNVYYPFLHLQFYRSMQLGNHHVQRIQKAHADLPIKQLASIYGPMKLSIARDKTVAQLLTDFKAIGLIAQVSRKSGNLWVETSLTVDWTLDRQNKEAILIS